LSLNSRHRAHNDDEEFASISVTAKREVAFLPCVHIHLMLADPDPDPCLGAGPDVGGCGGV
jgi:hypothetical protein